MKTVKIRFCHQITTAHKSTDYPRETEPVSTKWKWWKLQVLPSDNNSPCITELTTEEKQNQLVQNENDENYISSAIRQQQPINELTTQEKQNQLVQNENDEN